MVSVAPHDLKVGERIFVRNCTDDDANGTSTGVFDKGFNGSFTVASIVDDKTFTYNARDTEGVVHSIGNFTSDTTTDASRITTFPRFERNDNKSNLYIYRNETITPYIKDTQDGIYHLFILHADNQVTEEFTDLKFGQNVVDLYPQLDRDNNHSNPPSAVSFAKRNPIGDVATDDLRKSITRETTDKILKDIGYGRRVVGVSTTFSSANVGSATITFDRPHGFGSIKFRNSISAAGANLTNGTFHNIKLFNSGTTTWDGARASVVISGGQVGVVTITEGGSGYATETLDIDRQFIGGNSATIAKITVTNAHGASGISTNIGDSIQFTGVGTATDSLYRIASIPSSTQISVALTATSPRPQIDQYAINLGPSVEIASETFSVDTTTFTTTLGHGLVSGQKFKVTDANNQNLGSFFVKTKISATSFTAVTTVDLGTPKFILPDGVASATPLSDKENENLGSRGLSFYDGDYFYLAANTTNSTSIQVTLPNDGNTNIGAIRSRFPIGSYLQAGDEIMRVKSTSITSTPPQIQVIRSALGTPQQNHLQGDLVRKITPKAVEFRRPSIIRASGHTFEYLGFGPGNYSTALPQVQVRTLSEREEFLVQSQERSCGTVVYTGMNNRGDFFIGNKRVSSATGQERTFDAPIATVTGEDPSRLSVIFDEVIIKERLVVEGGKSNTILTQFDGPVTFNKLVKINEDLTVNGVMKLNNTFEITNSTQSTSKDDGAFVVEGGVGIERNLNVGGDLGVSSNIVGDGNLTIKGNTTLGDNSTDTHTFNGVVNFNHGLDINNIDIGGSNQNTITTDTGDLILTANSTSIVKVNDSLNVQDTLTAGALIVDQTSLNGNVLQTTSGNNSLFLQAHGTGVVVINDSLRFTSGSTVDIIRDEDDMASDDANALATQQSIKAYVDTQNANQQQTVTADSGTDITLNLGTTTLGIIGTSNEIETSTTTSNVRIGLTDSVTIAQNLTVNGGSTLNGNVDLGNQTSDTITVTGRFDSDLAPSTDDERSLGTPDKEWKNLYIHGIAFIDSLEAASVDIDGGTIDGSVNIGVNSPISQLRVDNVQIDGNTVTTTSGNLILDSQSGRITINDSIGLPDSNSIFLGSSDDLQIVHDSANSVIRETGAGFLYLQSNDTVTISKTNADPMAEFGASGTSRLYWRGGSAGIRISTTQAGMQVEGEGRFINGDVIAFASSDERLKDNIKPIEDPISKILEIGGYTFDWNDKQSTYTGSDVGVIAQEVEKVIPEVVETRDNGYKAVKYEKIVPLLIEAIKELKAEIEELKK